MTFVAQHLEYWKEKARRDPHEAEYILRWYDVKAFTPNSSSTNAIEVILSSLIGAFNTRPKPPDMMVIMLGDTKFWCDEMALRFTMDTLITVLISEIKRIIQNRQQDLPLKAMGKDPKLFVVKLNWKPENAIDSVMGYPKKRRTFNKLLDAIARPRCVTTLLLHEINATLDPDLFLNHGDLSDKGYRQVWKSLSEAIQDIEIKGKQTKKVFSVMPKTIDDNHEVESSCYSSEDDYAITRKELLRSDQQQRIYVKRKPSKNFRRIPKAVPWSHIHNRDYDYFN